MTKNYDRPKDDFYPTPPKGTYALLAHLDIPEGTQIWEPCCGDGAIAKILVEQPSKPTVYATDLYDHGYGTIGIDATKTDWRPEGKFWVITNPPFSLAAEVIRSMKRLGAERIICLLRFSFLESATKREDILEDGHLLRTLLIKERLTMYPGVWDPSKKQGSATVPHAWFIWDKNHQNAYPSESVVRRISLKDGERWKEAVYGKINDCGEKK